MDDDFFQALEGEMRATTHARVSANVSLRDYCRWRVGGVARLVVEPESEVEVRQILAHLHRLRVPVVVIGDGSNLLFDDGGLEGVVLRIGRRFSGFRVEEGRFVHVRAGTWTPQFVRAIGSRGLAGAQHAIGIPGTIGGLIAMNGGSQRKGIGQNVRRVWGCTKAGEAFSFSAEECRFAYRSSAIQAQDLVVLGAELEFEPGSATDMRKEMIAIMASRRRKFPLRLPNCGSVFLSNPALYDALGAPGEVIERVGFKGYQVGGARVSELHANFIVNTGNATSKDITSILREIRRRVHESTGFWLECEVRHVSTDGQVRPAHLSIL